MPEPFSEHLEAQASIILHPGSRYLRIGRPSDSVPHTVLHAIARKRRSGVSSYCDPFLVPQAKLDGDGIQELEECRLKVSHILQSSLMSDGSRRFATPPQQIAVYNKRIQPVQDDDGEPSPPWVCTDKEYIVGDEILSLHPSLEFNVHFPIVRGDLNIHSGLGGSVSAVLADLETIWGHCISTILNVPLKDLKFYRAVLIIPDIYNRDHVKKLTNLLLNGLGFGGCFVLQDHVAATFGAGLGYACVVDVGDQKTSISCVEDAISHPATRLRLDYGGSDVTQVFYWLLKKCGFPHQVNLHKKLDAMLLNKLKHEFCHVNLNECGAQEKTFSVHNPGEVPSTYTIQMGDELIVAALSLFYPDLLKITGPKATLTQKPNPGDPDDPFDENYLRETSRRGCREAAEAMEVGGGEGGDAGEEDIVVDDQPLPPAQVVPSMSVRNDSSTFSSTEKLLSLEQAILTSIDRCQSDEMKRKMYSSILIVGGGAKFKSIGKWLQSRLTLQIPVAYRPEQIEIITRAKDMDPCMTAWKGAALMTCLEGSNELWIQQSEWNKHGVKILREKCPFIW
ncbi:actin-related protein 8 isoform X1 [Procambarus clarkii]|uniref:actin-related protein 8 isoform X1 n=1 Tax=Procambarus clarkii TaxID=6728 RepID=UPI001E6722AD|nr:actin-related protein 8-like isoform X1 [Procambarus clarkii]